MPRPRFEKLPAERQKAIMEAAAKELASRGYEGASLNRILEAANLSKGAAYYYFDSKDDLLATMFGYLWEQLVKPADLDIDIVTADAFWPSIERLGERFMLSTEGEPWIISAAKAIWAVPNDARKSGPLQEAYAEIENWMFTLLKHGQDLGVVRTDIPLGLLLTMVLGMDEAGDRWVLEHFEELGAEEVQRIWTIIFRMWRKVLSPEEV
jgi:AcrR family transcriptional regulator